MGYHRRDARIAVAVDQPRLDDVISQRRRIAPCQHVVVAQNVEESVPLDQGAQSPAAAGDEVLLRARIVGIPSRRAQDDRQVLRRFVRCMRLDGDRGRGRLRRVRLRQHRNGHLRRARHLCWRRVHARSADCAGGGRAPHNAVHFPPHRGIRRSRDLVSKGHRLVDGHNCGCRVDGHRDLRLPPAGCSAARS